MLLLSSEDLPHRRNSKPRTAVSPSVHSASRTIPAIDGRLQTRQYQDKNGQNRTAVEIVAQNVSFCGSKESTSLATQNAAQRPAAPLQRTQGMPDVSYSSGQSDDYALIEDEGDLPF